MAAGGGGVGRGKTMGETGGRNGPGTGGRNSESASLAGRMQFKRLSSHCVLSARDTKKEKHGAYL